MSTAESPKVRTPSPLTAGQKLDQPTFHEQYKAMPPGTRAELVGGVVYMPSPLSAEHSDADECAALWIAHYRLSTPGLKGGGGATTKLGRFGEVQPDRQLRIRAEFGGQTQVVDGYIVGPPEFVFEIAKSSLAYDMGEKKAEYEEAGVREYVVAAMDQREIHWFSLHDGRYTALPAGADEVFRSQVFPGLWLAPAAFFDDDLAGVIAALDRGLATPEHAAFAAGLAEENRRR